MNIKLKILDGQFSIHRLDANDNIPDQVYQGEFCSIVKTADELSIVCNSSIKVQADRTNSGWACIKLLGPLDFSLLGILSNVSTVLANSKINIYVVSTYDTDYILVDSSKIMNAKEALIASGYFFED